MLRHIELSKDLGQATHEFGELANALRKVGEYEIAFEIERSAERASAAARRLEDRIEALGEGSPCPECGAIPVKLLGESCERAEEKMPVEDYYGDGSKYVPVGSHNQGWECPDCGAMDAEPCIHD